MTEYYNEYDEPVDLGETIKKSIREYQQEQQMAAQQAEANKVGQDVLDEHGLSLEDVQRFVNENPELAKQMYIKNMRDNAKEISRRRDPKTGRFLSGKAAPQPEQPQDNFLKPSQATRVNRHLEDGRSFQEKWGKSTERTGTDKEVMDMLTDMIGNDDAFKTTHQLKWGKK